jgi:tetratricopeptide (TPR) repeat protein
MATFFVSPNGQLRQFLGRQGSAGSEPSQAERERARADGAEIVGLDPRRVREFLLGRVTLGELEGLDKPAQYELAQAGYAYLEQNQLEPAARIFRGLAVLDPFDAYFQLALGWITHQQGELGQAEKHYSRSLEINPRSAPARVGRGEVRLQQGRLLEAAEDLTRAIQEDPEGRQPASARAQTLVVTLRHQLEQAVPRA